MTAAIVRFELEPLSYRERERIRRACVEEGLLEEGELLDLEDYRYFTV